MLSDTSGENIPVGKYEQVRTFKTGATRDLDKGKIDYEAFLSPLVIERYGKYMLKHQLQKDGAVRPGDNWQKGIPMKELMKSAFRHFMDWWIWHRGYHEESVEDALCALMFNAMAYLHALLLEKQEVKDG
jgi:hypothetical protein